MKTLNLIFLGTMLLIIFVLNSCIKEHTDPPPAVDPKVAALSDSLSTLQEQSLLPGFTTAIIKNDKIVFQQSFGFAKVDKGIKYQNETTQPIGSVSKTFIAAALAKAIEQGHFTLETPINDILVLDDILAFKVINPNNPYAEIKIKHLVNHTSGLIDEPVTYNVLSYFMLAGEFENLTLGMQGIISEFGIEEGTQIPLGEYLKSYYTPEGNFYSEDNFSHSAPGEEFNYSNIAASLAAYLIEVKTEMPFRDYVQQYIFKPLNMTSSAYSYSELIENRIANLYLTKNDPYPKYSSHSYPDGFLHTSNNDLAKFLLEMIRGYSGKGTILSDASYQLLFKERELPDEERGSIFWSIDEGRFEHTGGDPGVLTILNFDPVTASGYLILTNIDTDSDDGDAIFEQLFKIQNFVKAFEKSY